MHRSEMTIIAGFILVASGLLVLALGSGSSGGFFFVFPFVFVGTGSTGILLSLAATAVLLVISLRFCPLSSTPLESAQESVPEYIRTEGVCRICGQPIPQRAEFCAYCGSPTSHGTF